jgi:hypothetical protein
MCGLFGWNLEKRVPKRCKRQLNRLAVALMLQNSYRGTDSWGFYSPNIDRRIVGVGDIVAMSNRASSFLLDSEVLIAHTRKATTGDISTANCHPFRVGSLVGAHNGIVFNHSTLNYRYDRKCTVDSEHLFYHLAEGRELKDITGYGAITFHDKSSPYPIQMGVFNGGEFAYAHIKGIGVLWSSDKSHLGKAIALSGWQVDKIEEPYEDLIYSIEHTGVDVEAEFQVDTPVYESEFSRWQHYGSTGSTRTVYCLGQKKEDENEETKKSEEDTELEIPDQSLSAYPESELRYNSNTWPYDEE